MRFSYYHSSWPQVPAIQALFSAFVPAEKTQQNKHCIFVYIPPLDFLLRPMERGNRHHERNLINFCDGAKYPLQQQ